MITENDLKRVNNLEIDNVNMSDYPDFCDAFISYGEIDGRELTEEELDYVNDMCPDLVNELAHESMF